MLKPQKINIEDTNIALLGSDLEKKVKKAAAETEEQWRGVGKNPGLWIWRIEKFKVVPWPKEQYGSFFSGDSYILLRTYKKSEDSDALAHDVHFWLGLETSQDEAGTAAYKTVELDDVLGGAPVQHREVQGSESGLFLSYFPKVQIMSGGVETGFKHVEPHKYRARLLHIKGVKDTVVAKEVPLKRESLNEGDVFLIDAGLKLFVFNGKRAGIAEKMKGGELARAMSDERGGKSEILIFDQGEEPAEFWPIVGGKGAIPPAESGGDDAQVKSEKRLFRLTDGIAPARKNLNPVPIAAGQGTPALKAAPFDPAKDAEALKNAMGFFGTKTSEIADILGGRTAAQRAQIVEAYRSKFNGDDLVKKLESKTSFNMKKTIVAMFTPQVVTDAQALRKAIKGLGTDEACLVEILVNRTNKELADLKAQYQKDFNRSLEQDVADDTSGDFKKFLLEILKCSRSEGGVVEQEVEADAKALFQAGEGRWGTDEDQFIRILTQKSIPHLVRVFEEYRKLSPRSILEAIDSETSGDFCKGLIALVRSIISKPDYYQERLHESMKGVGTDDDALIRIIVARSEIDMGDIKRIFFEVHGLPLAEMISSDTSGPYQTLLLRLIGEEKPSASTRALAPSVGGGGGVPKLMVQEISAPKITRSLLDSDDVFIFDVGFEVFVWVGRGASKLERRTALQYAQDYLMAYKKPLHTPISRILEGGENEVFEMSFDI